jgi:Fe-S-cluster containining protein
MDKHAKAEKIADEARDSISSYCSEECRAYCCRKGYLVLKPEEVDTVTQGRKEELLKREILKKLEDGRYSLHMGEYDTPCPSLKDFRCTIYDKRPDTCRRFPLFIEGDMVKLSPRCLAVKEGKFFPYVKQLMALRYKMAEAGFYYDMELYRFEAKPK